jgi:hypothetical protein
MSQGVIEEFAEKDYEYGFVTDIESEGLPPGLNEGIIRQLSAIKGEPAEMTEYRLKAFRHWQTRRGRPVAARDLRKARHPHRGAEGTGRRRGRRGVRQRLGGDHLPRELAEAGVIFCSISEAVQDHPELVKKYLGTVVPPTDNYYAALNSAVYTDGTFVYVPKTPAARWSCQHLLPHQYRQHRPVRAHADRRRRGQLRQLPGGLHGAAARREPAARRGGGADRHGRRRDQVLDGAELVPGRRERRRRHLQLRHQARRLPRRAPRSPGPRSRPARPSPGSIRAASCAATTPSASSTRWPSPRAASRPTPAPR